MVGTRGADDNDTPHMFAFARAHADTHGEGGGSLPHIIVAMSPSAGDKPRRRSRCCSHFVPLLIKPEADDESWSAVATDPK